MLPGNHQWWGHQIYEHPYYIGQEEVASRWNMASKNHRGQGVNHLHVGVSQNTGSQNMDGLLLIMLSVGWFGGPGSLILRNIDFSIAMLDDPGGILLKNWWSKHGNVRSIQAVDTDLGAVVTPCIGKRSGNGGKPRNSYDQTVHFKLA